MIKEEAMQLISTYATYSKGPEDVLHRINERFPHTGSEAKAMRWLGFCQGVLLERGVFTLDQLKEHSHERTAPLNPHYKGTA